MPDPLEIVPIRRSRVSQGIVVQFCRMIRQGQLRPGGRLPSERDLSEQLGVSRASLREALWTLENAGIIETRQGSGTYVREVFDEGILSPLALVLDASTDLVGDLWEVRSIFEPAIAFRAAIRAQKEDVAVLARIVAQQKVFLSEQIPNEDWLDSDRAFHIGVARASHNDVSVRVIRLINELLHEGRSHFATQSDRREHAYHWHREILEQISVGDPQHARDAMLQHLREVEEVIVGEVIAPDREQPTHVATATARVSRPPTRSP